jgi:alkaline phosphatase
MPNSWLNCDAREKVMLKRVLRLLLAAVFIVTVGWGWAPLYAVPTNIIFFIGDGMGFEQVKAANFYAGEPLSFERFPHQGQCTTYSASSSVTDSAAAATAIATATKVNNGVVSLAYPGDGSELETLLESTRIFASPFLTHFSDNTPLCRFQPVF